MLETALSLFDYFIKLVEIKEGNLDEYFDIYVKPAFEIGEKVFSDYLKLFHDLKKKIEKSSKKREVIDFIEEGRIKYLPLRRQIYAEVRNRWNQENDFERLPKFEKGLLGIIMGGLAPLEAGEYDRRWDKYSYPTPYLGGHSLLDIMLRIRGNLGSLDSDYRLGYLTPQAYEAIKEREYDEVITRTDRSYYLNIVDRQITALESAWQDVVEGYSQYKSMVAIKPARVKKLISDTKGKKTFRYKRQGD